MNKKFHLTPKNYAESVLQYIYEQIGDDIMEENLIKQRCCFTGHRPDKLGYTEEEIKPLLEKAIDGAIEGGYVTFISGMAKGTDIWAAEIVLEKKKKNRALHLVCAIPHPGFINGRSAQERRRYENIIKNADKCVLVSDRCLPGCYQKRNIWMVDRSSGVIAVFNGTKGGTANTINYAKRHGVKIVNVLER